MGDVDGSRRGEKLRVELDYEPSGSELKSFERIVIGEGGMKMGEDLGHGCVPGRRGRLGRRTTPPQQGGAEGALAEAEPSPESLPGSVTEPAADVACGVGDAVGDGALEETPQQPGGGTRSSDFVGEPNADGASATRAGAAVRAKNSSGSEGFFAGRSRRRNRADSHGERECRPHGSAGTPSA